MADLFTGESDMTWDLDPFGDDEIDKLPTCLFCSHFLPIGEGDHICDLEEPVLVMEDYEPTDDYFICGGAGFEKD